MEIIIKCSDDVRGGTNIYGEPIKELVRCAECRWSRPRTFKGETGYRCVFYRVDKAETGYCDIGEREVE